MPFIEHYNILKPLLLPLASDPVYAQFLQQARKMAITPISRKSTGGDDADTKRTIDHQPRQGWLDEQGNRR